MTEWPSVMLALCWSLEGPWKCILLDHTRWFIINGTFSCYNCVTNSNQQNFMKLWPQLPQTATLNARNISHHAFKMDVALYCVKSHGLVNINAGRASYWNKMQLATSVKLQMHIDTTYACSELIRAVCFQSSCLSLCTSVKTSLLLLDCRVSHSLVKFVTCRHNAVMLMQ